MYNTIGNKPLGAQRGQGERAEGAMEKLYGATTPWLVIQGEGQKLEMKNCP